MNLIVGLGNPGREYADTRHNLGFAVVDRLAQRWSMAVNRRKFSARVGEGQIAEQRVVLLKPTTYVNRSGQSVLAARQFYKLAPGEILVVLDDLDLPTGKLRLRPGGSAGGHKGLEDIVRRLGETEIPRLRVGIGKVPSDDAVGHVLSRFDDDEQPRIAQAVRRATEAVEFWLREGIEAAMNEYNRPEPNDET